MSSLNKMKFPPLMSGFSVDVGSDVIVQQLDGGSPRFRKIYNGTPHNVNVSWKLKFGDYQYLMAFYRVWQRTPSKPFLIDIAIDDSEIKEYKAFFAPGSFKLVSKNGNLFNVSAQIIVIKANINKDMDDLIVALGNEDIEFTSIKNPLDELVNQKLPDALLESKGS